MFRYFNHVYTNNDEYTRTKVNLKDLESDLALKKSCLEKNTATNKFAQEMNKKLDTEIRNLERQIELAKTSTGIVHKGLKRKIKKRSNDWIKEQVLDIIKTNKPNFLKKEEVARLLQVKECQVEQVFHQLNLEGILYQATHHALHDTQRDPYGFEGTMGWAGDIYYIRDKDE